MTFEEHINAETKTIEEFSILNPEIIIDEIKNESFSRYDFEFTSGSTSSAITKKGICEVKTRTKCKENYGSGVLIELDKLNALMKILQDRRTENINDNTGAYYLSKFQDITYLFDVQDCQFGQIHFIICPVSSSTDGSSEWVHKPCFLLNERDAILTIYED